MKIFVVAPVRDVSEQWKDGMEAYVRSLEAQGHTVHYPPRDTRQDDPTGLTICRENLRAIQEADEVHVAWDGESEGVLFDLGMAFALEKIIKPIIGYFPRPRKGKSFQSMVHALEAEQWGY